jgi:hypothetical protein
MVRAEGHEVLERVVRAIAVDVMDVADLLAPPTHLTRVLPEALVAVDAVSLARCSLLASAPSASAGQIAAELPGARSTPLRGEGRPALDALARLGADAAGNSILPLAETIALPADPSEALDTTGREALLATDLLDPVGLANWRRHIEILHVP